MVAARRGFSFRRFSMQIERNKVVTFHYTLTDEEGSFTESSEGRDPVAYLHGHRNIVPGLEEQMAGRAAGDTFKATIEPDKAYGPRQDDALQRVPIKHLIHPGKLAVGKLVAVNTSAGQRQARVVKVGRFNADLDFNHPLAGRTLIFDVSIVAVRDATREEVTHKHAHGPGGHGH
jgi:FKBP-type peptidyl-prolyl cis-trans isomerase SlyD